MLHTYWWPLMLFLHVLKAWLWKGFETFQQITGKLNQFQIDIIAIYSIHSTSLSCVNAWTSDNQYHIIWSLFRILIVMMATCKSVEHGVYLIVCIKTRGENERKRMRESLWRFRCESKCNCCHGSEMIVVHGM